MHHCVTTGAMPAVLAPWATHSCDYPEAVVLFAQGQELQEVLRIVSGTVKLTQVDASGVQSIVGLATAGQWLGTAAIITRTPAPFSAVTCSASVITHVPARDFDTVLGRYPELSLEIHRAQARELCGYVARLGEMCRLSALKRLERVLARLSRTVGVATTFGIELRLPIHHWELAEFIGVTPEHLSRLLKGMQSAGRIQRRNGCIVLEAHGRHSAVAADRLPVAAARRRA